MPHDGPGEHYHDSGARVAGEDDAVIWTTVGFDIGSSTSQAVFSRITLMREDAYYVVVDRQVLHQSDVMMTPYATPELIDRERLTSFIERELCAANLTRADIDTGAVIMTGLALSSDNARTIADAMADEAGTFVAVSAGDMLEARLAANGAGLPYLSANHPGLLLHADIGGGTTKLSLWRDGVLCELAAIDVGARLLTTDRRGRIETVQAPLANLASAQGISLRTGEMLTDELAKILGCVLAEEILRHGGILPNIAGRHSLLRTAALFAPDSRPKIHAIVFSGGVSEYIYGRETREFGDLGLPLGQALRRAVDAAGIEILRSDCGIRATVLGASQHSVQLSGNTILVSDPASLPLRNLAVVMVDLDLTADLLEAKAMDKALSEAIHMNVAGVAAPAAFAIAIRWQGSPTYQRLDAVAEAIIRALQQHLCRAAPCVVFVAGDVAGLLGARLQYRLAGARAVICLDGVELHEFDHVDIGQYLQQSHALPVVVKSLLFNPGVRFTHVRH